MTLRQRQPRVEEPAYLAWVRKKPCTICRRPGSDPAHIRTGAREHGKRQCGMGEKPDDKWALPLCRPHHDEQHRRNELQWWASYGIDPIATAIALYASWPGANRARSERPAKGPRVRVRPGMVDRYYRGQPWARRRTSSIASHCLCAPCWLHTDDRRVPWRGSRRSKGHGAQPFRSTCPRSLSEVSMTLKEYRIVQDKWFGYEVQERSWWWPFWRQCNFTNTHHSLDAAEAWARQYAANGRTAKYLGRLDRSKP